MAKPVEGSQFLEVVGLYPRDTGSLTTDSVYFDLKGAFVIDTMNGLKINSGAGNQAGGFTIAGGGISLITGGITIADGQLIGLGAASIQASSGTLVFSTSGSGRWQIVSGSGHLLANIDNAYDIGGSGANRPRNVSLAGGITHGSTTLLTTTTALTNGAAAQTATLTNGPAAGNPTKWVPINDNGTTRYIPAW